MGNVRSNNRPQFFIELGKRAAGHHLSFEPFVLCLRAINPVDSGRLRQVSHLFNPIEQMSVFANGTEASLARKLERRWLLFQCETKS